MFVQFRFCACGYSRGKLGQVSSLGGAAAGGRDTVVAHTHRDLGFVSVGAYLVDGGHGDDNVQLRKE